MQLSIMCPNCDDKITITIIDSKIISVEVNNDTEIYDIDDSLKKYNIEFG